MYMVIAGVFSLETMYNILNTVLIHVKPFDYFLKCSYILWLLWMHFKNPFVVHNVH